MTATSSRTNRALVVPERGHLDVVDLSSADVQAIRDAGSGRTGHVLPVRASNTALLTVERLAAGRGSRIRAKAVVGFLGLPSGRVLQVQPKLGCSVGVFWLLSHALDRAMMVKQWTRLPADSADLIELLLTLLCSEVRSLVRRGIRKDYVSVQETGSFVRGRVLPFRTVCEARGLLHTQTCLHDDHTANLFENQVLRLALRRGAAQVQTLRHRLLETDALLEGEVDYDPQDGAAAANTLKGLLDQHHPSRRAYIPAHRLAYMVLRLLSHSDGGKARHLPGVLINMERIFELALRNMLCRRFGAAAFGQHEISFGHGMRKGMRPDICLRGLIVDAKYKEHPLTLRGQWIEPPHGDVFQAHTYSWFARRPCALVYATGAHTRHADVLSLGLGQQHVAACPRVGLFRLDIASTDWTELERRREELERQLDHFRRAPVSEP